MVREGEIERPASNQARARERERERESEREKERERERKSASARVRARARGREGGWRPALKSGIRFVAWVWVLKPSKGR